MSTDFTDKVTLIDAAWLNMVDGVVADALNSANTPSLARTALDVPQETVEGQPQCRVQGAWVPLSTAPVALHAAAHALGGADQLDHDNLLNSDGVKHVDHSAIQIIAGSGLSGGGSIESNRTLSFSYALEQSLNAANWQIFNLADPTLDGDGANKKYVDDHLTSPTSTLNVFGIPTDPTGLAPGDVWSDNGALKVVT